MSALNEADFGSDTDDDDYVPEGEVHDASEEENSGEEENTEDNASKGKKKKKSKKAISGRKNIFEEEEEKVDWKKELEEERKEINEEKEKQKANDLFAAFKKDTSVTKAVPKKNSSISSLFDSTPSTKPAPVVQNDPQKTSNRLASLFDDIPKPQPSSESNSSSNSSKPKSRFGGLFDDEPKKEPVANQSDPSETLSDSKETKSDKIEIKKVFDFAGEMVTVSKEVEADSTEAKKYLKSQQEEKSAPEPGPGAKRPGGLAGIVGSIGKKQKMGVLDKSKLDWNSFVKEEGIKEELTTHNKGKDG